MGQNDCCQLMNHLISDVEHIDYQSVLTAAEDKLGIKQFKITQIAPSNAAAIYHDIYLKFKKNTSPHIELNWWQNELRMFIWVLVCYTELKNVKINELGSDDFQFFSRLFPNKQQILFQYQSLSLLKETNIAKKWLPQQDELFSQLIQSKDQKYKWSQLAKELYIKSNKVYFRTPKQCRERWLNHLDPNKSKMEWGLKEDFTLITHVRNKGKKWAEISKLLKNRRNEHSIKNRYKSLITKQQKLHAQKLQDQDLVEHLYRKYDNHFAKIKSNIEQVNNNNFPQQLQQCVLKDVQIEQEQIPTTTQVQNGKYNKKAFQIYPSSTRSLAKIQNGAYDNASFNSIQLYPSHSSQIMIPSFGSSNLSKQNLIQKQEREKQIRADMFLSSDPFDFLKRFFRSKDFETME